MQRSRFLVALLAVTALLAAACGGGASTTDAGTAGGGAAATGTATETATEAATMAETPTATPTPAATAAADATGPVTVEGANGPVGLDAPAENVVALEWTYVEDLLALGVQPIGVADISGYQEWVDIEPRLDPSATDVGTRQEPSLETIAALQPDLIIGVQYRHEPILDQLEAIAPTVLFNPYPAAEADRTQLEEMTQTFRAIAQAVGKPDQAGQVLGQMRDTFDEVETELAEADLATDRFALAQGFTAEEAPTIRMFTANAMAVEILEQLGLENVWQGEPEEYGFNTVGVEALTQIGGANFMYVAQDEDNIFTGALAENEVWQDLGFVTADRVFPLGGDTWLFGGPLSAEVLAEDAASLLAEG
jgi:iron complex transport system substrate-binding protein